MSHVSFLIYQLNNAKFYINCKQKIFISYHVKQLAVLGHKWTQMCKEISLYHVTDSICTMWAIVLNNGFKLSYFQVYTVGGKNVRSLLQLSERWLCHIWLVGRMKIWVWVRAFSQSYYSFLGGPPNMTEILLTWKLNQSINPNKYYDNLNPLYLSIPGKTKYHLWQHIGNNRIIWHILYGYICYLNKFDRTW